MSISPRFAFFPSVVLAPWLAMTSALAQTPVPTAQAVSPSAAPTTLAPVANAQPTDTQRTDTQRTDTQPTDAQLDDAPPAGETPAALEANAANAPTSKDAASAPNASADVTGAGVSGGVQDQAPSDDATERRPGARRDTWFIGFALGTGPASSTSGETTHSWGEVFEGTNSVRLSVDFEVGATISPQLLLGGRIHGMREATEVEGVEVALQHTQYLVNATYFPLETGEGPFLRGGLGLAALAASAQNAAGDSESASQGGIGTTLGIGYAFWLGEAFNLTVSNDLSIASFSGDEDAGEPTSGWFNSTQLGFYWY